MKMRNEGMPRDEIKNEELKIMITSARRIKNEELKIMITSARRIKNEELKIMITSATMP
jgi:hypothetical protein